MSNHTYLKILKTKQADLFRKILEEESTVDFILDKETAKYLIPLVEKCITTIMSLQPMIEKEQKKGKTDYKTAENSIKLKIYETLDALYDIIQEDTCLWRKKWDIDDLSSITYNIDKKGLIAHIKLTTESKFILKNNQKQYKKCCKWRNKVIKWFIDNIKLI